VGVSGCPLGGREGRFFHDRVEVEVAWVDDAPNYGIGFAFGGGLVGGQLFFHGHDFLEDF